MRKTNSLQKILGGVFILAALTFIYFGTRKESTVVDEFNIYWMFTISALGLGGLLLTGAVTAKNAYNDYGESSDGQNVAHPFNHTIASRVALIVTLLVMVLLAVFVHIGAASYFVIAFVIAGIILFFARNFSGGEMAALMARIFTGSLFVVSGLIKANDPKGFGYKLEEYFREDSLGTFWSYFHDAALPLAIFIASIEVVLGLAVLFGGKARLANWSLFGMALFFAWLTWYTASCNDNRDAFSADKSARIETVKSGCGEYFDYIHDDLSEGYLEEEVEAIVDCRDKFLAVDTLDFDRECVNDCGCFGDALKGSIGRSLTPWESFYKDITLLFFVLVLLLMQKKIKFNSWRDDIILLPVSILVIAFFAGGLFHWYFPIWFILGATVLYLMAKKFHLTKIGDEWTVALLMFLISFGFTFYCYSHLPIKDFRPYAIGHNLIEERTDIPDQNKFYYKLRDKKTGEEKEFEAFPENYDQNYDFVGSRTVTLVKGKEAPARDFSITVSATGEEITDTVLAMDRVLLFVMYHIDQPSAEKWKTVNELSAAAKEKQIPVYILTASIGDDVQKAIAAYSPVATLCSSDEKVLKTVIRSNPGLVLLKKAVVINKWPAIDLPAIQELYDETLN